MALTDYSNFTFPNFNVQGFPYQNLIQQLQASMQPPTPGSYKRFGGTGTPAGAPGNAAGGAGSPPPPMPLPGAVAGPGGTYPMPTAPQFIGNNRVPSGVPTPIAPPGPPLTGTTSVPPAGFNPSAPPANIPPPGATPPPTGIPVNGSPMVKPMGGTKMAQVSPPQMPQGLLGQSFTIGEQLDPRMAGNPLGQQFIEKYNRLNPVLHVTAQDFNRINAINPAVAYQLAAGGGQPYRDAIMAQNGTNQDQMNQWINNVAYNQGGLEQRMTPDVMAMLRSLGIS